MLKKTITYTDYDDNQRTEDFYFNFSKAELAEMELSENGGMSKFLKRIIDENDNKKLVQLFKEMVLNAYGKKSDDGKRFIKSQELRDEFSQTEAYTELFMELASSGEKAAAFFNAIVPASISQGENPPVSPFPTQQK